jgi:DNA-binding SARP family transcriptional activator
MNLRSALLERIGRARPRVVRIVANAGWGKSRFIRALAAEASSAAVVEAGDAPDRAQLERMILDALALGGAPLVAGSLREAWAAEAPPELFALEDVHLLGADSVDLVRMLLRALPPGRLLVLTSRTALPVELSRWFAPHEIVSLGSADLALGGEELRAVIDQGRVDPRTLERAAAISRGWPICAYLFGRFAREGRLAELLDRLEDRAFDDLYAYAESEIVAGLGPTDLDLVLLCAALPVIEPDDVRGVLGDAALARLDELVAQRLYVTRDDGCYRAPLLGASLARNRPAAVAAMRERCAAARDERGDHCGAAEAWLAHGDPARAAAALDRAGPPVPGVPPSRPYLQLLLRVPLDALLRTRHAFVALLTSPRVAASPHAHEAQARAICERLGAGAERGFRISAQLALAVLSFFASNLRRADEMLEHLAEEHAREPFAPERAGVFVATRAAVAALRGRTVDAAALWASAPLEDAEGRTVYEVQRFTLRVATALSAGEADRVLPDVQRQVALARDSGDPIWIADMRLVEAAMVRRGDDDLSAAEIVAAIEREELGGTDPAEYRHILGAAELPPESRSIPACVVLMATAYDQNDPLTARRLLESAIAGFDRIGRPQFQISARLLMAFVPGAPRARLLDEARRIAAEVQDPRTLASVEAIAAGRYDEAPVFRFPARHVNRGRFDIPEASLRVEILGARVTRAGSPLALRTRELEVLAALALARAPVARLALAAKLWGEDAAEDAAPALRTAMHRLRKQLADPNAVVYENGAYRLGPLVTVDVHDIEAVLSALRRLDSLTVRERDRLSEIVRELSVEPPELYQSWDWMRPHLAHLHELRRRAAVLLVEDALEDGSPDDAVAVAEGALRGEPLDEPLVELAIRGLLAAGRRSEAIRRARRYADDLARELGGEPSSELVRELAAGDRESTAAR